MQLVADDVQSVVIPGAGHFVAEEAPEEMLAALTRVPGPVPRRSGRRERHPDARHGVRSAEAPPVRGGASDRRALRGRGRTAPVKEGECRPWAPGWARANGAGEGG